MSWEATPEPLTLRAQRQIDDIFGYVVLEELAQDDLEITSHPVQRGAEITDHAYKKPEQLSIRFLQGETETDTLESLYQRVLDLQARREPFVVVTGKRLYRNMLLLSVTQTTDKATENVLSISCTLRQIRIVEVTQTTVPPRSKQKTPAKTGGTDKAGAKQLQKEEAPAKERSVSLLKSTTRAVQRVGQ